MKVFVVCGGGVSDGNTARICRMVMEGIECRGADVIYEDLTSADIGYCTGCNICRESGRCYQRDDMDHLIELAEESDIMILATPVRFSGPSSLMKRFTERFQPYWHMARDDKSGCAAAVICGGSPKPDFNNVIRELKAFTITMGREWVGELTIPSTDTDSEEVYGDRCIKWGIDLIDRMSVIDCQPRSL